ncbi:uncharacterized protein LOC135206207 [Macrobrachium nipponense]|uniref:uncharacterized protein LOC135206207 n=1 Tax=Macrobrachium nipponense TaxID=159736 RepID=UPI0030C87A45
MSSTKTTVSFLTYLVVVFTLSAQVIDGAKDKVTFGPKAQIPDDKLFQDQVAFCEGCYGFVQEIHKLLMKWSKEKGSIEDHIDAAMVAVCSTERLRSYVLSPPKMERLCAGIRAHYEDDIGLALLTHYGKRKPDVEKVFSEVCKKAIPACPKNMKPMSVGRKEQREKEAKEKAAKEKSEKQNTSTNEEEEKKKEGKTSEKRKQKTGKKSKNKQKKDEL